MLEIVDRRGRRYRRVERALSPRSINMHISLLAQILVVAVDHGHLQSNPAAGRRRRLKVDRPRPVHLDSAVHIAALLQAGAELDQATRATGRRAAIAVLLLGGGRASATGALLWRDVDLANGRLLIGRDKTDAGMREVDMLPLLREILTEHKAATRATGPDDPVFATTRGKPRDRHNIRQRVVAPVVEQADALLAARDEQPLPAGITPHKLRHTFASILVAIGRDPTNVMEQLGHTDPAFTLRVYAHIMRRSDGERERLRALVEGQVWALNRHRAALPAPTSESTTSG
jgi:integrase